LTVVVVDPLVVLGVATPVLGPLEAGAVASEVAILQEVGITALKVEAPLEDQVEGEAPEAVLPLLEVDTMALVQEGLVAAVDHPVLAAGTQVLQEEAQDKVEDLEAEVEVPQAMVTIAHKEEGVAL